MTEAPLPDSPTEDAPRPRAAPRRALDALADAMRFFTRIPVPSGWGAVEPDRFYNGAAAASPVAGAAVGAASGAALIVALALGLPPLPAALFSVAAGVAASGALHLDGLGDVADGFGGGATRERKLEIMRDSRLGSYGGAAVALALIARTTLAAALVERLGGGEAALALMAAGALSRPLAFLPVAALAPARSEGLGHDARPSRRCVAAGCALGAAATIGLGGIAPGVAAIALAASGAAAVAALARRQIGGHTGDVCGAGAEIAEIAALAGLIMAASPT